MLIWFHQHPLIGFVPICGFHEQPDSWRRHWLTFKFAAAECLGGLSKKSIDDTNYLFACVLEAQQSGDKQQTIAALQKVLEKYEFEAPPDVSLPALLRYVIDSIK